MKKVFLALLLTPFISVGQNSAQVIPLWENGAPGFENLSQEKEEAEDYWVKNIHNPSITAYFPASGKSNGTAVLIFPGGGHRLLVIDAEGTHAQEHLNKFGITAFVLKYRLAREPNSLYEVGVHAKEDAQRAMRLIRKNAEKWGLDKEKIGIMGFSAGGEVANWIAYDDGTLVMNAIDEIDNENYKPDFQILIYPGPLGVPTSVHASAPPTFALAANDDECCSQPVFDILKAYRKANAHIEAHFYSKGGHGFNMGYRSDLNTISHWPARLEDWLVDFGYGTTPK